MEEDDLSTFNIYDDGDGIVLEIFIAQGVGINFYMDDDTAQDMVDIIQNKLNARFARDV